MNGERKSRADRADEHTSTIRDASACFWEAFARRARGLDQPIPLPFGSWTNAHDGGLLPGVHMLIGRTKSRKSTIAAMTALHAAEAGHPVAIVPIELRRDEMFARLLGPMAGVPWSRLMTSGGAQSLGESTMRRLGHESEHLASLPILIDDPPKWLAKRLGVLAPRLVKHGTEGEGDRAVKRTPLVVVDYLQRVQSERERDELRVRIGQASAAMQRVAKDHGIAVLLVSSTSRAKGPLLGGHAEAIEKSGVRLALDGERRAIDGDPDELIGASKESGDVEYDATSLQVLMRVPGQPDLAAMVLPAMRYTDPTWIPLRMKGAFVEEGSDHDASKIAAAFGKPAPNARSRTAAGDHNPTRPNAAEVLADARRRAT